ncbi:hypothetical protein NEICINOT_05168 [Neisseria cinerea ATCC 14685]|uniref:Uncharacterized protein n=1 Tax=Neisseria cinerea ATCC 14685 TaxID=546262 RepID=D0W641_NEICI|nr:hypothetical protein NEICINOT_05168 [Neisseria cinerea ATCC 14685]
MGTDPPFACLLANALYRAVAAPGERNRIRQRAIPHNPGRLNAASETKTALRNKPQGCFCLIRIRKPKGTYPDRTVLCRLKLRF